MEDLRDEVRRLEQQASEIPTEHPRRADSLRQVALAYGRMYAKTLAVPELEKVIYYDQQALSCTPFDSPGRAGILRNIGSAYLGKYLARRGEEDLVKAIDCLEQALEGAPKDGLERAKILQDLAASYGNNYERTREIGDIDKSMKCWIESLKLYPLQHPHRAVTLNGLITTMRARYEMNGIVQDLELCIQYTKQILSELLKNDAAIVDHLRGLGSAYRLRYGATGQAKDLDAAIHYFKEAMKQTSMGQPCRAECLHDLGSGYFSKSQMTGNVAELDAAVKCMQDCLSATPKEEKELPRRLQDLGGVYHQRSRLTGAMSDLQFAIKNYHQALGKTPEGDFHRPQMLRSLGKAYHDMHEKTGDSQDTKREISYLQEGLNATPENNWEKPHMFHDLGAAYATKFLTESNPSDLEEAIQCFGSAIRLLPVDSVARPSALKELGTAYATRHKTVSQAPEDLIKGIELVQEGLDMLPTGHQATANILQDLGTLCLMTFDNTTDLGFLERALQSYQNALSHTSSPANARFRSGMSLVRLHANAKDWPRAATAAFHTVSLVPLLTPRFLQNEDKQHILIDVVGLASDAAAATLHAGHTAYEAIRILELGRGIITGSLTEIRADIQDLQKKRPDLAEEYLSLRKQLDTPKAFISGNVDSRYEASQALERLLPIIRQVPTFGSFLSAQTEDVVLEAAKSGPIVIINVSRYRCDALIAANHSIRCLPLLDLRESEIRRRISQQVVREEDLEWLWRTVAGPVLKELGWSKVPPGGDWPRIWWIPTGELTRMPIHAAGNYTGGPFDGVMDHAISSYATSIKTIIYGRYQHHKPQASTIGGDIVLVGMQKTPGFRSLDYAQDEIKQLEHLFETRKIPTKKPEAFQRQFLSALESCKILHFAGHGTSHASDPLQSRLLLVDHESSPMTVSSLMETNIHHQRPLLAYLSACETGQVKRSEFTDESMHLMAACQLAGFQNVIGTLWKVDDRSCVDMALKTYEYILDRGMSDASVSEGLHHAARWLRARSTNPEILTGEVLTIEVKAQVPNTQHDPHSETPMEPEIEKMRASELVDDDVFSSLYWVPYIHIGV